MIESGEKDEEYRDLKPYWWKRIFTSPVHTDLDKFPVGVYNGKFQYVTLQRAYEKNAKVMLWKMGHQGIGIAKPEIAMGHMRKVIVLPLIDRVI